MIIFNLLVIIFSRTLVVSTKYARYSDEHWHLLRTKYLSTNFLVSNLLISKLFNKDLNLQHNYLLEDLDAMKVDEIDFFVTIYSN